ncbi:response regulator receiver domain protein (macronuclear) [Tetrahymena thermophila SB210]|uniref:Response regulator receiver domain protein n=1 Tax=Tetrahymena thermophila (strain SB210) TaxID=312017 RepID=I7MJX8_TETTS|nr:response regulator receiver domain protein [Tetrahymena thermophila SB210]EAS07640.2 response regulator receiver domain protein [Tetrahymena thermophila SB210]|eukprot:XP_001027882.2 response regulator receiver domain protein [Tetrahymena thermophila SB210]
MEIQQNWIPSQTANGNLQININEQNSYQDQIDKEIITIKQKTLKHQFIYQGNDFFLNVICESQLEYIPSLLDNLVLLIQIAHLCAVQYLNQQSIFNNQDNGYNRVHMYIGITFFSLGYIFISLITLLCSQNYQRYKDGQIVLYNITLLLQLFNVLYYLFWILYLQDQLQSIQWLTFDITAIFLYYFSLRQTIIKNYLQNWFLFLMLFESIVLAMLETSECFYYGIGQIILIIFTISLPFICFNTKYKKNQLKDCTTLSQKEEEVLYNLIKKEKTQNMQTNQNKNSDKQSNIQTITQGLYTLHNLDMNDLRQQANNILKNRKSKQKQDSTDKNNIQANKLNSIRNNSQHSLSISMDASQSQNNFFASTSQIHKKNISKQLKNPFLIDKIGSKDNNNNPFQFKDDVSIADITAKQGNSKMLQSDGFKIQSYLTFNMEKNCANILNTSSLKGSPPLNSQRHINFNIINNQKPQQGQLSDRFQLNVQNKQQKTMKSTPNFPFLLDCDKKLSDIAKNEKFQFHKNTFLQQVQQVPIADTYPIISLDKDLNIIHHSNNLIDLLASSQNAFLDGKDQYLFNNTQKYIDTKISYLNSDSIKIFKSTSNDALALECQAMPFLSQKLIESKALQNLKRRNLSNYQKKKGFQKFSEDAHQKQVQELRYLLETTYVQIIEFYESDKKRELIKSFFHHDTISQKYPTSNFKLVSTTSNTDKTKHTFNDLKNQQLTENHINNENLLEFKQKQEIIKNQSKQTQNNSSRNSFSQSPALLGYRKAAIKSLSSNIHFGLNLNSNSTLSNYKYSANELVLNEGISSNKIQLANQIPKSFINISKSDIKNQTEMQQTIQNTIQTLNHIPQDLTYEENSNGKLKQSSPTKHQLPTVQLKQLISQPNQPIKQAKQSPQTLIIPSFQQLRDPSQTSFKQDNLIQQKSQEEFVQNIYQFERPCFMNSLKKIIQNILELEKDNEITQVTYRIMKGSQIQFIPSCPNCDSIKNQNKKIIKNKKNQTPKNNQKSNIFHQRKLSDNFCCSIKKFNLDNISIDIIVNPMKGEKVFSPSKTVEVSNLYSFQNEKIRLVFRRDFSASFFENVYFVHSLHEEQNRSKAEVLLVKKLFIDSFQSVSHEFGTALNCINNLSEVALGQMNQESGEQLIKPIRYNSAVIQYLINDILDHHMILQNTFVLQIEKFSLLKFKEEIMQLFRLQIEYKKLSFDFYIDPQLPEFIYQDKHRIQSILMTMIRNAIKYTQHGKITVELKIQAVYSNNPTTPKTEKSHNLYESNYVQKIFLLGIKVKDTGVGLDESESKKLIHLLNYGFCNESISKNSLGNGVGGLCVSNLIAIKLSGRENLGIQFERNNESASGTIFRFFVECQAFQKQRLQTMKLNPSQFNEAILNHLPTILDNTAVYDNNLADSSLIHNVPSSSKINSPNELPAVSKTISLNPFMSLQASQQVILINQQQPQQGGSANLAKNNIYQASMTLSQNLFAINQNQQSVSSAHHSQIPNSNTNVQMQIQQITNNLQSQQGPNSLNSSFNTLNYNFQNAQFFEQQTEEYQVENLFKNMLFLRAGGGSGSQNQQQQNQEEQDINESLIGTPLTYNQLAGSVSPLQFLCGKKSHFTLIPKTPQNPQNRNNYNELNSKIQNSQQKRQSQTQNSSKNITQQQQIMQQNQNTTNQNISSINSDLNEFQQVFSQRKVMEQSKNNQIQEPISLQNIKQESVKQEIIEEKLSTSKKIQPSSRLDSLRPKTSLHIKHTENLNTPHFNVDIAFFSNKVEEQKMLNEAQEDILKRQSSVKRQSCSSININTNSFVSRKTRITFGAQDDQSLPLNRDRSQNGSDLPIQNQNSFKIQNSNFQPLQLIQSVSQEIPIKQNENNTIISTKEEISNQNTQNKGQFKIDFKCDKEIREESDSKIENSTESCLNKQYSFQEDIADERLENEKPNIVGEFSTFNDKQPSLIKLSSPCCVKVLCVDDEPFNHFVMKQILKAKQINCDTALNGEEGVEKFKQKKKCLSCGQNSYSLILMDLNMPIKNGFEATYEIKQYSKQHQMSKVIVITCSAFIDIASKIKAQQSGSDFFISKPISQSVLFNLLQEQLLI